MTSPTPHSRALSLRDYAAPASILHRRGGNFIQPLSGGACSEGAEGATLGRQANAGQHMHLPSAATAFAPGCSPRCPGMAGGPDGKVRGRAALDLCVTGTSRAHGQDRGNAHGGRHATRRGKTGITPPAASGGLITGPRDSAQASSRGAASTLAGLQPVAVDAAAWKADTLSARRRPPAFTGPEKAQRSSDCAKDSEPSAREGLVRLRNGSSRHSRSSARPASSPSGAVAGSAAPRGRSTAGKDNGRTQARPKLPACSSVQTQLAGAARPGPFPGRDA